MTTTQTIGTREPARRAELCSAADILCLAAAPAFATMAVVTGVLGGGPQDVLCAAAHDASPLDGMAGMYALMSAFHTAPWLKLLSGPRRHRPRS